MKNFFLEICWISSYPAMLQLTLYHREAISLLGEIRLPFPRDSICPFGSTVVKMYESSVPFSLRAPDPSLTPILRSWVWSVSSGVVGKLSHESLSRCSTGNSHRLFAVMFKDIEFPICVQQLFNVFCFTWFRMAIYKTVMNFKILDFTWFVWVIYHFTNYLHTPGLFPPNPFLLEKLVQTIGGLCHMPFDEAVGSLNCGAKFRGGRNQRRKPRRGWQGSISDTCPTSCCPRNVWRTFFARKWTGNRGNSWWFWGWKLDH